MAMSKTEIATIQVVGTLQQQLAMMQLLLQALTNGCDCAPCQSLRSLARVLSSQPRDGASDPPSTGPDHPKTTPPEASAEETHRDTPQTARFDGVTKEM